MPTPPSAGATGLEAASGPPVHGTAGPGVGTPDDLSDILERLHDDLALEQSVTPEEAAPLTSPLDVKRPESERGNELESTGGLTFDPAFASFGARLAGVLIDTVVLALFVAPGVAVAIAGGSVVAIAGGIVLALAGFVLNAYLYGRAVSSSAKWIGNRVTSTSVVDARNGTTIDVPHATTRFVVRQLISPILLIGFLQALGDSQRRAFHDKMAGSVVIRPARATWSVEDETP